MYGMGEPVKINNEVHMPVVETAENDEAGDTRTPEEKRLLKELRKKEEELQTMEAEHRYELERRINEEAEAKLKQFLVRRSESLEKERTEILDSAKREANALTADAKATTMSVIKKAETECIKLREEARREGHDQGYAEGRTESLEKYKTYIDAAGRLLSEINSRKEAYYISGEEEMRETVFELVRKVIGVELKADPAIIDGIIGEAAKNFRNSDYIKITLADDEISERFITDKKLMRDIIPYIPEIEIEFDDEAPEGTVIIDDGAEIVDASIPTQLDFLKEILRNTRGEDTEDEAEFMEEIKGRAHRRKSVTIGAGSETAEEIHPRAEAARGEAARGAARPAARAAEVETAAVETARPAAGAEMTADAETVRAAEEAGEQDMNETEITEAVMEETAMAETIEAAAQMAETVEAMAEMVKEAEAAEMAEAVETSLEIAEAVEAAAQMAEAVEARMADKTDAEAVETAAEIAEAVEAAAEMAEAVEAARKVKRNEAAAEIAEAVEEETAMAEAFEAAAEMASAVEAAAAEMETAAAKPKTTRKKKTAAAATE